MKAGDLSAHHGASVWVMVDRKRTLMRLHAEPPLDPFLVPADGVLLEGAHHDRLPAQAFVLTEAQMESMSEIEPGVLDSKIVISGSPQSTHGRVDAC